jgi:poly(A) polymerase
MALSRERIASEVLRLLIAPRAVPVVALMIDHGILLPVLPEITAEGVARLMQLAARETASGVQGNSIRRLAALIPPDPALAEQIGARLRLSKDDRRRLVSAVTPLPPEPLKALAYRLGPQAAIDRLLIASDIDVASIVDWTPPRLPITGGALVERGIDKGPEVARLLHEIEDAWIAEGFPDAARVSAIADALVDQARRSSRN